MMMINGGGGTSSLGRKQAMSPVNNNNNSSGQQSGSSTATTAEVGGGNNGEVNLHHHRQPPPPLHHNHHLQQHHHHQMGPPQSGGAASSSVNGSNGGLPRGHLDSPGSEGVVGERRPHKIMPPSPLEKPPRGEWIRMGFYLLGRGSFTDQEGGGVRKWPRGEFILLMELWIKQLELNYIMAGIGRWMRMKRSTIDR